MNNLNIPIYRAKKIDNDKYVEGDLFYEKYIIAKSKLNTLIADAINHIEYDILKNECINENCKIEHIQLKDMLNKLILNERFEHIYEIDPTTLAINFSDMLDSQGNKIFASLSENGKGGDIIKYEQVLGGILKSIGPEECIIKYCNKDHIIAPFFINAKYKNQKTYMTKEHLLVIGIQK